MANKLNFEKFLLMGLNLKILQLYYKQDWMHFSVLIYGSFVPLSK